MVCPVDFESPVKRSLGVEYYLQLGDSILVTAKSDTRGRIACGNRHPTSKLITSANSARMIHCHPDSEHGSSKSLAAWTSSSAQMEASIICNVYGFAGCQETGSIGGSNLTRRMANHSTEVNFCCLKQIDKHNLNCRA
ncbi:hypothetical protein RRF57_008026 [Xylaria bambusicola]|uniref:Uncharacterized protein n=1 Tax=Xylaria bambusicola TaxID=326684 RepID=A0AAN7USX8_9PEZI